MENFTKSKKIKISEKNRNHRIGFRILPFFLIPLLISCITNEYIHDPVSREMQRQLRKSRTGFNFAEFGLVMAGTVGEALGGPNFYPEVTPQSYCRFKVINPTRDTLYINMLTDKIWKDSIYYDIRELHLPPRDTAKVVVPIGINYNIYFRNHYLSTEDHKIEINTAETRKVRLNPNQIDKID